MPGDLPAVMLLDMDDTILDDTGSLTRCWQSVLSHFAPTLSPLTPEQAYTAIREYSAWFWGDPERHRQGRLHLEQARRDIVAEALRRQGVDNLTLAYQIADLYSAQRDEAIEPFPKAMDTLAQLRQMGIRLGLITNGNSAPQRRRIVRFGLEPYFACIVIEGEFGVGKPNERVYRHALKQLGAHPIDAWMVGDNLEWDVAAPQRLGIRGIWHDFAGRGLPALSSVRPYRIISSLSDLLALAET